MLTFLAGNRSCLFHLLLSIHSSAQSYCGATMQPHNNAEITSFIPVLAGRNLHLSRTPSHQRWDAWPTNYTPRTLMLRIFFILPALHMQDTFMLDLNFQVGHFACQFLLLSSFWLATKGIHSTQLRCHISFLSFVQLTTCSLSSRGRSLDSYKHQLFCLHIQYAIRCLFEWWTPVISSEAAVCGFCLSISLQY